MTLNQMRLTKPVSTRDNASLYFRYPTSISNKAHWAHILAHFPIDKDETTPKDTKQDFTVYLAAKTPTCVPIQPLKNCPGKNF